MKKHLQKIRIASLLLLVFNFSLFFLLTVSLILPPAECRAQTPQKMSYQTSVRNSAGAIVAGSAVGIRISILQGSMNGTVVYEETHTATTNANGSASLEIGGGTVVTGTFANINWASGLYFLKTETDPSGGTNYTIAGTSQLLSVPYAIHAKTVEIEKQTLSFANDSLSISGGNKIGIPVKTFVEKQTLSFANDSLSISGGNKIGIPAKVFVEKQTLSFANDSLSISGGNKIVLPKANSNNSSVPQYSQAQIDALTATPGMLVFNTDYKIMQFYDGTSWNGNQGSGCVPQANYAEADINIGGVSLSYLLNANNPDPGIKGKWIVESGSGGGFVNASDPKTTFTGTDNTKYVLKWTLSGKCDTNSTTTFVHIGVSSIISNGSPLYAYPVDNSTGVQWYNGTYTTTGATSTTDGQANTIAIVASLGAGNYAAYLCDTLTALGHSDWYLPAKDELDAMYSNKLDGDFIFDYYWSSTESDTEAWRQSFGNGSQDSISKSNPYLRVRCVRR